MLENDEILEIFKNCQAILEGHFLLSSGLHSPKYIQCAKLLQYPDKAALVCNDLAKKVRDLKVDVVVGPAMGGIIVAHEVAKSLGVRAIFAERENSKMSLRRGFSINEGERVLIVEDVITTGGSILEVANLIKDLRGRVISLASLIDRSNNKEFGFPTVSLLKIEVNTYGRENCPLCQKGLSLVKPGSKKI
ncbi:MAG: orotate phosphoribosyltransferase [bacterium]|nr:orotate phosphoribosyltransferase [bacterium]